MTIKTRFALLLGGLLVAFLAAWFWLSSLQQREAEAAYADAREVREQVLSHLLDLGGRSLPQLTASFASVSGGYGAGVLITALDPLYAGITEAAARVIAPSYGVPGDEG